MKSRERTSGGLTTDVALVVQSWDPWLADATGITDSDACGRPLAELFPELERRGVIAMLRRVVTSGAIEVLAPAFHGYLIPCAPRERSTQFARMQQHATISPLRDGGTIVGLTVWIEDVTGRLERERELAGQLASDDDAVRLRAVRALSADQGSTGPLASALGDRNWHVRHAAAEGLAHGHDRETLDTLLQVLRERHRDPAALNAAIAALVHASQDVVPRLVELLEGAHSSAELRMYGALALGLLGDARAAAALLRAVDDQDANVRFHAVEALGRVGAREAVPAILAIAESRDFTLSFAALDALAAIGDGSVAPRLVPLLDDELLQDPAVDALGRLGGPAVVQPLASLLRRARAPVSRISRALAAIHARMRGERDATDGVIREHLSAEAAQRLVDALPRASDAEALDIVTVLGCVPGDQVNAAIASTLGRSGVRHLAADALAQRGAASIGLLRGALASDDAETRKTAAAALGRIGAREAVPALVPLLDDDAEVAVVAAGALGSIGDRAAFEPLLGRLDHPQAAVRQAVVAALSSIGDPEMPLRVRQLLAAPSPRVREAAVKIVGYFGYRDCVERVLALTRDPEESVRRAAVEQLPYLDDARAEAAIGEALASGAATVRAAAARALAHASAAAAHDGLPRACADPDPWVRYYAARSTGHQAIQDLVPVLVNLATNDPLPPVRIAAVEALAEMSGTEGVDTLLGRLALRDARPRLDLLATADADPNVRQAAQRALAR